MYISFHVAPTIVDTVQSGGIVFQDVEMRYRKRNLMVLSGVSFEIDAGSSVGICGRTGSYKKFTTNRRRVATRGASRGKILIGR